MLGLNVKVPGQRHPPPRYGSPKGQGHQPPAQGPAYWGHDPTDNGKLPYHRFLTFCWNQLIKLL